ADGRLARARLADEANDLAALHVERDVLDRLHVGDDAGEDATTDREVLPQVPYLEEVVLGVVGAGDFRWCGVAHARISDCRSSSFQRTQRTWWPLPASSSGGMAALQRSCTKRQRGWKAQPSGRFRGLGTLPGMAWRRSWCSAARSTRGIEFIRPSVYGISGS